MLTFAFAVFLLIITPGPGVLSTAGIGSAFGFRAGISYVMGLFVGTSLVSLAVVTGVAAIILAEPTIRIILVILSTSYLFYLAARIALAGANLAFITSAKIPGFYSGVFLQFVNPKAYAVNTALFTSFAFMPSHFILETLIKYVIMSVIWMVLHLGWLYAGLRLGQLDLSPVMTRRINHIMALCLVSVVLLSASSHLQA